MKNFLSVSYYVEIQCLIKALKKCKHFGGFWDSLTNVIIGLFIWKSHFAYSWTRIDYSKLHIYYNFFGSTRVELRTLYLSGRCSTTFYHLSHCTSPFCICYLLELLYSWADSDGPYSYLCFPVGKTGMHYHAQPLVEMVFHDPFAWAGLKLQSSLCASWVARIKGMSHSTWFTYPLS
jgi:hypothetical protein